MLKKVNFLLLMLLVTLNIAASQAARPLKNIKPKVIILTGASCSGKSTIMSKLKKIANSESKWQFIAADELEDLPGIKTDYQNLTYDDKLMLYQIFKYADNGFSVLGDTILYTSEEIDEFKEIIENSGYAIYIIYIHTSLDNLVERVRSRQNDCTSPQSEETTQGKALEDFAELNTCQRIRTPRSISSASPFKLKNFGLTKKASEASECSFLSIDSDIDENSLEELFIAPRYDNYDLIINDETQNPIEEIKKIMGIE